MSGKFPRNLEDWLESDDSQEATKLRPHSELPATPLLGDPTIYEKQRTDEASNGLRQRRNEAHARSK
jgi:hypothetical protein